MSTPLFENTNNPEFANHDVVAEAEQILQQHELDRERVVSEAEQIRITDDLGKRAVEGAEAVLAEDSRSSEAVFEAESVLNPVPDAEHYLKLHTKDPGELTSRLQELGDQLKDDPKMQREIDRHLNTPVKKLDVVAVEALMQGSKHRDERTGIRWDRHAEDVVGKGPENPNALEDSWQENQGIQNGHLYHERILNKNAFGPAPMEPHKNDLPDVGPEGPDTGTGPEAPPAAPSAAG